MSQQQLLGYLPNTTPIHRLNGASKLICLILLSFACMTTYDTRFLLFMCAFSVLLFALSKIRWRQISFVVKFILIFSLLNILAVYIFAPEYGVELYGSRTVLWEGIGRYTITSEQLFYEFNLILKYICTIPLALVFLLTTNPSEFASSLNRIGVSYKISYSVALALRYIPDIQEDFFNISQAQQARGYEMSKKGKLFSRLKGTARIVLPLIFSSLERIEVISTAMELRRFGKSKKRTWYAEKPYHTSDYFAVAIALILTIISFTLIYLNGSRFYNPF
ncbi:energy-coupling factor transporter transmembrane component T family protein [Carnobacterium maltaromaticum]|uniref:energy-coupling factor transporter transmembrane component T family protein n=1 Tax=Carnobacterium maltaromaticum TaxID=2751 RepID=UPI00165CC45D|nr:energy-coupling factor transporter transmembrane component T [Carnobacterium maltaromaticum]MBC9787655.1 energy-coupling factor transporter transmembrane protein EcfT [Carnobacterium maltaromaticum]